MTNAEFEAYLISRGWEKVILTRRAYSFSRPHFSSVFKYESERFYYLRGWPYDATRLYEFLRRDELLVMSMSWE
jgi:hypothetical protein